MIVVPLTQVGGGREGGGGGGKEWESVKKGSGRK